MASRHSERQELKRAEALADLQRQVKRGNLTIRRITKAELAILDAAAERRRVHAPALVDVEAGGLP